MTLINLIMYGVRKLVKDQKGQAMVEYGLIIALVAIVIIGALVFLTDGLQGLFTQASNELTTPQD